jgi:phospholipase C
LLLALSVNSEKVSPSSKIKKIILLCLENHSYDNMVKDNKKKKKIK